MKNKSTGLVPRKKSPLLNIKRNWQIYILALPGLAYLFINNYMPLPGLVLAFKKFVAKKGIWGSDWVGLANFEYLFQNDAWYITRNTILYNLAFIIVNTVLAITVAIILSEMISKMKKVYQSVILLPYMISWIISAYLVYAFLGSDNGFLNNSILKILGIDPIAWYNEKRFWPFILTFVSAWKGIGYVAIVYVATISGFNVSIYEAARIDGASKMQQITKITLPMLRGIIILMTLMSIGRIFYSDFGLFYQIPKNSGALYPVTQTIDTYVYRGLLELGDVTMSAAAGFYQSLVGFSLVIFSNWVVRKLDNESALF